MTSVLRDSDFLRYFVSRVLSGAGNIVTLITLPIIVYRTGGSPSLTALVAACEAAPYLLFGLVFGAWSVGGLAASLAVTYRQQVTPEHLLGRVNTAGRMLAWEMGWTGGAFVAGVLVGWLGLVTTLVVLSATQVVAAVVAWASPLRAQFTDSAGLPSPR